MKKFGFLYSTLFFILLFSSCQKEENLGSFTIPVSSVKIKTYSEEFISPGSREVNTFFLDYDEKGRLTTLRSESNSGDKFMFKYTNNSFITELYQSRKLVMKTTSFIGSHALIDSTIQNVNENEALTEKYFYSKSKQLVKVNEYVFSAKNGAALYNTHSYVYDAYGNVAKDADLSSVTTYEYYLNLKNNISISPAYIQEPENLVKSTTYTSGGATEIYNHAYTFDSNNRINSEKITKNGNSDVLIKRYMY